MYYSQRKIDIDRLDIEDPLSNLVTERVKKDQRIRNNEIKNCSRKKW